MFKFNDKLMWACDFLWIWYKNRSSMIKTLSSYRENPLDGIDDVRCYK